MAIAAEGRAGGSAKERDEAMSAAPSGGGGRGRGGGNGQRKPRGQAGPDTECWNCHEKGHFAWACPKKDQASGAKGEGSKASTTAKAPSKGGSANAATDADSEDEGAWCALEADLFESDDETDDGSTFDVVSAPRASDTELDDSDGSLPGLLDISDTEDDGSAVGDSSDWFSEMDEEDIPAHPAENAVPPRKTYKTTVEDYFSDEDEEVLSDDDNASVDSFEFIAKAELKGERAKASGDTRRELYDSGASRHISPYRDDFADYVEIAPREFSAANEQKFHAVGQGEVTIDVPNGADTTHLTLTEVLYSPEVGYTLVSVVGWMKLVLRCHLRAASVPFAMMVACALVRYHVRRAAYIASGTTPLMLQVHLLLRKSLSMSCIVVWAISHLLSREARSQRLCHWHSPRHILWHAYLLRILRVRQVDPQARRQELGRRAGREVLRSRP